MSRLQQALAVTGGVSGRVTGAVSVAVTGAITAGLVLPVLAAAPGRTARGAAPPPPFEVVVEAGAHDRNRVPVSFLLPPALAGASLLLRGPRGAAIDVQPDARGRATFVLPALRAGRRATFSLTRGRPSAPPPAAMATREAGGVHVAVDGRPVLVYRAPGALPRPEIPPELRRGGYLHPLFSPGGVVVTDDYPANHLHHHGVWTSWATTAFEGRTPDFWNMGKKTGRTDFEALEEVWQGPVHAGLRARHLYEDLTARPARPVLRERWEVVAYRTGGPHHVVDLEIRSEAVGAPLRLGEHRYGGLGVRGHAQWSRGKEAAAFLTSDGRGRADGDATRARWVHLGGSIDGKAAGVAVLGHPENLRAPQRVRLHPEEPFFSFAPTQDGAFEIRPGSPHVARYRIVVADGPPDARLVERLWRDYAEPPRVTLRERAAARPPTR
jgi:hypothetical protein